MFFSFKNFIKASLFLLSILVIVVLFGGISYYIIDKVQTKNNLMDIEEYTPISTLVVPKNIIKKSKFPFIDVHSHQWNMAINDLSSLVVEMDSLNMKFMINLSGSGFATFSGNQDLMDLNLEKSIENIKKNYPTRFGVFVNLKFNNIEDENFATITEKVLIDAFEKGAIGLKIYKNLGLDLKDSCLF